MSSYLIRMKRPKGKRKTEAECGVDEAYARELLEKFKASNPGYQFALVTQQDLLDAVKK